MYLRIYTKSLTQAVSNIYEKKIYRKKSLINIKMEPQYLFRLSSDFSSERR